MTEKKKHLVPRLRFPEFRDAGPWEVKRLGEIGNFYRGLSYSPKDVRDQGLLVLRAGNIQDGKISLKTDLVFVSKSCPEDLLLRSGDIVICMSNGSKSLVGKSGEFDGDSENNMTVGAFCSIFRPTNAFARFVFQTPSYEKFIEENIAGGNINNIKISDLENFGFYIPSVPEEQQKIADCLSSLDEVIEHQAKKLEALKTHKRGLMQQLFPREGETTPRLRFPEFRDAGPWEVKRLGEVCEIRNGSSNAQDHCETGTYPLFDRSPTVKRSTRFLFDTEAVIIPGEGSDFSPKHYEGKFDLHQRAYALMNFTISGKFLFFSLDRQKSRLTQQAVQSTVRSLRMPILENFLLSIPTLAEQQKIADCLSSLDEVIEHQAKKLEALKTHKRGLMQQLFPQEVD